MVRLNLWDTAGQEKFRSVSKAYFRNAVGAVLVFSLADRTSFDALGSWLADIHALCTPTAVVLLVGNKSDLSADRVIGTEEARAFGDRHGIDYMETSALDATNINESFLRLTAAIHEAEKKREAAEGAAQAPPSVAIAAAGPAASCC
jgi:small GTP-binding protein